MSPASGDRAGQADPGRAHREVSIQLMSPASGDFMDKLIVSLEGIFLGCFHSINVPSEWGHFMSTAPILEDTGRFHSINVPSEWGLHIS